MKLKACLALLAMTISLPALAQVDLEGYLRKDPVQTMRISPNGDYYAMIVPMEDRTVLVVIRRSDKAVTARVGGDRDSVVDDFWWANPERVVVAMAERFGTRDQPSATGMLHAVNADGSQARVLAGPYVQEGSSIGSARGPEGIRAYFLSDTLPGDKDNVLVDSVPFTKDPYVNAELLNIYTRRRTVVATAPVRRASFYADAAGEVRFASGADGDNNERLYHRLRAGDEWQLVNEEIRSHRRERPLGFSADGKVAYLQVEEPAGPDAIYAWHVDGSRYEKLLRDNVADPYQVLYDLDNRTPIGASFMTDRVRNRFFDDNHPTARLYRSLERAFEDNAFYITSATADRKLAVIYAWSDRNNGDYFLFDTVNKTADRIMGRREWFHPSQMPPTRAVSFKTRDGLDVHGYLTTPVGAAAGPLPTVVMPHGGPYGIFDEWQFDDDASLLAQAGYAVLRVNYRGSGNYGRAFTQAGAREWGGKMQDDLTDATQWAIAQKLADPQRICIYGASYGGYAALMGAAREPDLYRCAAGYVGVYDLQRMHRRQSNRSRSGKTWAGEWLGTPETLAARSPVNLADRIKVPVFLAAGGKDERAPLEHSQAMEKALKANGVPVETLYYPSEGHGFYTEAHRREYYTHLLDFLSRHLGGAQAK